MLATTCSWIEARCLAPSSSRTSSVRTPSKSRSWRDRWTLFSQVHFSIFSTGISSLPWRSGWSDSSESVQIPWFSGTTWATCTRANTHTGSAPPAPSSSMTLRLSSNCGGKLEKRLAPIGMLQRRSRRWRRLASAKKGNGAILTGD